MGHYCIAFGKLRPTRDQDNIHYNTSNETDSKTGMVWISYKGPVIDMLDWAKKDLENDLISVTDAKTLFVDISTNLLEDGRNCNYNDIINICQAAQTTLQNENSFSSKSNAIREIENVKTKYERLDDSRCWGHVEAGSPLSDFSSGEFICVENV